MAANPSTQSLRAAHLPATPSAEGDWRNPLEEEDAFYIDQASEVVRTLPWMALALVGHALALFIAVFIVTTIVVRADVPPSAVSKVIPEQAVDVVPEEKQPEEVKELDQVVVDPALVIPVQDTSDAQDESDLDTPVRSPNPNLDDADSPNPNTGNVSNSGLGGGGGGGNGGPRGGGNGFPSRDQGIPKIFHNKTNAALQWLADHQNRQGYWNPNKYHQDSTRIAKWGAKVTRNVDTDEFVKREDDLGMAEFKVGLTGLALLAFVGDGQTHEVGKFNLTVKRAAQYLLGVQDAEGCFGARERDDYVYSHAICTMAIAELYAITSSPIFKGPTQRAVDFIVKSQNPGLGWRYGVQPRENDSSVTAWMVLALKSAKIADIPFDDKVVYAGANAWYDKIEGKDEQGYLVTGYHSPASGNARPGYRESWEQNAAMDACNAMVRLFTHQESARSPKISKLSERMLADPPTWLVEGSNGTQHAQKIDYYYWYYGSLAAFQAGGETWKRWERALFYPVLLANQRGWHEKDLAAFDKQLIVKGAESEGIQGRHLLDEHGSWDALDPWSVHGGRVYATAINCLTLEVYYRYARVGVEK